jgi:elongation factor Ts
MSISAAEVNKLRQMTGAGLMDCKKALTESNGDMDAAVDLLRAKGAKLSAKRADRSASEGAIIALTNDSSSAGVVVELNCETDFVGKNEGFVALATEIANIALAQKPKTKEDLLGLNINGSTISDRLVDEVGKIGEKIELGTYEILEGTNVVSYIHAGNKLGVLVNLNNTANATNQAAGKDVAMQIAAMNPIALDQTSVSQEVIDREIAVGKEQALSEGKPAEMIEKIAMGKLNKFYKDNTLMKQDFVKDGSKSVEKMLSEVESGLTVTGFCRVQLGGN